MVEDFPQLLGPDAGKRRRQKWPVRLGPVWFLICLSVALLGCAEASESAVAGQPLAGTSDLEAMEETNFSVSPGGEWILYRSNRGSAFNPVFVLYDIAAEQGWDIPMSPQAQEAAEEGRGPLMTVSCWSLDQAAAGLRGDGRLFRTELPPGEVMWYVAPPDLQWRPWPPASTSAPYAVRQESRRLVALVNVSTGEVLETHRAQSLTATGIRAEHLSLSPDRAYLTYAVSEEQGSFTLPTRGYLLPLHAGPPGEALLLAVGVLGPVRWHPDGDVLFAAIGRDHGLFRWSLSDLVNREGDGSD